MSSRAPKQWCLTTCETVNSFENWKQNLLYTLSLDKEFSPFLRDEMVWSKKSKSTPLRGFSSDTETVPDTSRRTAQQKVATLELMLGQIANFCPIIARNSIVKNSTSLNYIWQIVRLHYGFQSTGAHFLDLCEIKLESGERPEDLYQRLNAFIEDNLLKTSGSITHHGERVEEDEEFVPTLENYVVLTWLRLVNESLPRLVKQRYGTELRTRTLASIKPEISLALPSLLEELQSTEDANVLRSNFTRFRPKSKPYNKSPSNYEKSCPLCKEAGRPDNHFLSKCSFLPDRDRQFMAKSRMVDSGGYNESFSPDSDSEEPTNHSDQATRRVQVEQSPYLNLFYKYSKVQVTLDSGATANMVKLSVANRLGAIVTKTKQSASQADGKSPLLVVGETKLILSRGTNVFKFDGLVVEQLDVDFLGGVPFMKVNDIQIRPARNQITFSDGHCVDYGRNNNLPNHSVRLAKSRLLRADQSCTVWPGNYVELEIPEHLCEESELALEPHTDSRSILTHGWPKPMIVDSVGGSVRIPNFNNYPIVLKKGQHVARVASVNTDEVRSVAPLSNIEAALSSNDSKNYMAISLDSGGLLSNTMKKKFTDLHREYKTVFRSNFGEYNGHAGPIQAIVNMGPTEPPQRKGRVPQYSRDKLVELQNKFDELELLGVFKRPEDLGIVAEYLNPSFLVKKPKGGFRLVTAFSDVGRYSKPQPSLMPDVDGTLRSISRWRHIISTDLTSAFYQIPVSPKSLKYCGVATPFKGVRVYSRCAMGMPGSETALEELMCRVLGALLMEGVVAKLADDLYIGGDTVEELFTNWRRTLDCLSNSNLTLSASKTIVCPKSASILGWIWSQGTLAASPHKVACLSSCSVPGTVKDLRSFIGAYKILSRVLPQCAHYLDPLETIAAGMESNKKLIWNDDQLSAFQTSQRALTSRKIINLPKPDDTLWIVTDGASKGTGIGATLYIHREKKTLLAGFFSARVRQEQIRWLPCEIEALSIASAIKHYSPYIVQSKHKACVLTDSKPCVQAFDKLCRGEYSSSPRVATFLATVSRFQVNLRHISGAVNLVSDFSSRNSAECSDTNCQVCSFAQSIENSVVRNVSSQDILTGKVKLPFTNRKSWQTNQMECPDLRRVKAQLSQGTRPSKKQTKVSDIKRYLNTVTVSSDGLLVVSRCEPLGKDRELIVVPRALLEGLLTALHIKLNHPSCYQLKKVTQRYFFALDMESTINDISTYCHQCATLKPAKKIIDTQSTTSSPKSIGSSFSADVVKRHKKSILVVRENVTSYTTSCFVKDEKKDTMRDGIISLCSGLYPLDGSIITIRTDPAPCFVGLQNDSILNDLSIKLELGHSKNPNKNPIAEKAIRELEDELVRLESHGTPASTITLSLATSNLNSRIRHSGLSSREMLMQRDQFTGQKLSVDDSHIMLKQSQNRHHNHPHSEKTKCPNRRTLQHQIFKIGDIIYINNDKTKLNPRERYIVVDIHRDTLSVRKFCHSQLRIKPYIVKKSQCFKVPPYAPTRSPVYKHDESTDEDSDIELVQEHDMLKTPPIPATFINKIEPSPRRSQRVKKKPDFLNYSHF